MKRFAVLLYGVMAYAIAMSALAYLAGFIGNVLVPKSIDGVVTVPLWQALLTNISLILLFAVQHSVMARPWFKKWWTRYIPAPIERSTYILVTSFVLMVLYAAWEPMGGVVWAVGHSWLAGLLWALFGLGWMIVVLSSFLTNHFDLFGLRQVWMYFRGEEYKPVKFKSLLLYNWMRHPLYFGLLLGFWATPVMSVTHLFFSLVMTTYILRAIRWEEKDLVEHFGESYRRYAETVPMLLPFFGAKQKPEPRYQTIIKGEPRSN